MIMHINIFDNCQLRVLTDAIVVGGYDTYKHPLGFYFNDRVLNAIHYKPAQKLARASDKVRPTNRGYAMQYYCPVCGRVMWCTLIDTKQPAVTCRKCRSDDVEALFGTPLAEKASWAYTTLLSENYDPLIKGDSTLPNKLCKEWTKDPMNFVRWFVPRLEQAVVKKRYSSRPVWLIASGKQWDKSARISREYKPRGAKVRII